MKNRLLARLSDVDRQRLVGNSVVTSLVLMKELYRNGQPIDAVYFPLDCVVSVLVGSDEQDRVEMATIGNEGAVGVYSMLNTEKAIGDNVVQVAGDALRLDVAKFDQHIQESRSLRQLMHRYLHVLMCQMLQAGACNWLHTMEERCARWLLMMHDRMETDAFPITQEFLAQMLAVRRATVNVALGILRAAGFIRYARGQLTIVERAGLESAACPCYQLIRREYEEMGFQ